MVDAKLAKTKNQHYVPQFYQRFFSADLQHKTIGAYIIERRKYIPKAPIKNQSSEDYFYSPNQKVENSLGEIEKAAALVINRIFDDYKIKLSKEDSFTLYAFTFLQIGRTLDRVNVLQENVDKITQLLLKKYVAYKKGSDDFTEHEDITREVLESLKVKVPNPGLFTLGSHAQIILTCIDLKMKILVNKTSKSFVTSDNPACMYSMFLERIGILTYAFASKGLMFYMPFSKDRAVMYYDSKCYKIGFKKREYVEITQDEDVDNLNLLTACYANKILYCYDGSISKIELEFLANRHDLLRPQKRVEAFEGIMQDHEEITGVSANSIYCHLKLSFVKELPLTSAITTETFNPQLDMLRPIAYLKDKLVLKGDISNILGNDNTD